MAKKLKSTHDLLMASMTPQEKDKHEKELKEFVISELILAAMEQDNISVRKLAKLAGVSPTIVQEMRSGRESFNIGSFFKVLQGLGYSFILEKDGQMKRLEIPHLIKRSKFHKGEINERQD